MKKLILPLIVLLFITRTTFADVTVLNPQTKNPLNVSYIQSALVAVVKPVNVKEGLYKLTLKNVGPYSTYFSDRPNRVIGQLSNLTFLTKWQQGKNSFSKDAPNAVLSGIVEHQSMTIVMALSNPVYNPVKKTLSYRAEILNNGPAHQYDKLQLFYPTLFIDGACLTCMG